MPDLEAEPTQSESTRLTLEIGITRDGEGKPAAFGVIIRDTSTREELGRVGNRLYGDTTDYRANCEAAIAGLREAEVIRPTAAIQVLTPSIELADTAPYETPWSLPSESTPEGRPDISERMAARELHDLSIKFPSFGYTHTKQDPPEATALARQAENAKTQITGAAPDRPGVIEIEVAGSLRSGGGASRYGAVLRDSGGKTLAELSAPLTAREHDVVVWQGLEAALRQARELNPDAHLRLRVNGPQRLRTETANALRDPATTPNGSAQKRQLIDTVRELLGEFPNAKLHTRPTRGESQAKKLAKGEVRPTSPQPQPRPTEPARPAAAPERNRPSPEAPNSRRPNVPILVRMNVQPGADPWPRINTLRKEHGISSVLDFDAYLHSATRYPAYLGALHDLLNRSGDAFHQGADLRGDPLYRKVTAEFGAAWREAENTLRQRLVDLARSGESGVVVSSYPDRATIPNLTASGYLRRAGMYPSTEFVGTPLALGEATYQSQHLAALGRTGRETDARHLLPRQKHASRVAWFNRQAEQCATDLGGNQRIALLPSGFPEPFEVWRRQPPAADGDRSADPTRQAGPGLTEALRTMQGLRSELPLLVRQEIHRLAASVPGVESHTRTEAARVLAGYRKEFAPDSPRAPSPKKGRGKPQNPRRLDARRLFPVVRAAGSGRGR